MVKKFGQHISKWLFLLALLIFVKCSSAPKADLVIHNGNIYTMAESQSKASFVVVKDGKIIHVGSENAQEWINTSVNAIDLQGKTMTPGLIEGHGHFIGLGAAKMWLNLLPTKNYDDMIQMVEQKVNSGIQNEWILGRGWHQDKWNKLPKIMIDGFQVHTRLSQVSPNHPVVLRHASGHALLANAKAMQIAGITKDTKVDGDGEILRFPNGEPTGIFTENAMDLITMHIPQSDEQQLIKMANLAMDEALSHGITSFHDAGASKENIDVFKKLADEKKLRTRLWVMLSSEVDGVFQTDYLNEWYEDGPLIGYGNDFLTVRGIKLYSDGALGARGAWLLRDYEDRKGHYGHETLPMDKVYDMAKDGLAHGFQICTHAIGDRANREVLDNYEKAFKEQPDKAKNARFRIEHAQHLSAKDIPRFAQLGVIPAMQGIHMSSDRPWAIDRLGKERIEEGAYVWRKLLDSGAVIVNGTDVPVEPINPLASFYATVSRRTLDGHPPGGYEPSQKMTREEALRSYTLHAAYGGFEEKIKGSIEIGKLADFTIFSQDIMTIPEDDILKTDVEMTIVDGKVAYEK